MTIVFNDSAFPGTRIIPRSFTGTDASEIPPSASRCFGVVHQGGVNDRRVWVQITFFEAIQDNARGRRDDVQIWIDDVGAWVIGYVDLSGLGLWLALCMYLDLAQEGAARAGYAQKEEDKGSDDDGVYTDLDGGENDDEDTGPPDDAFQRGDSPEGINLGWGSYEISDGVDDDCRKGWSGDPEESVCQAIESDNDTDGGEDTSERGPDTRLGFECRAGEGTGSGVGTEARPDGVGDTDSNQLLVGVDLVSVDTSKRWWESKQRTSAEGRTKGEGKRTFGDGDVLEKQDDGGDGKL